MRGCRRAPERLSRAAAYGCKRIDHSIEGEITMAAVKGTVNGTNSVAVSGTATGTNSIGVEGKGDLYGVKAHGTVAIRGEATTWHGVEGVTNSTSGGFGVFGTNTAGGTGVGGFSTNWVGVYGETAGLVNGPAGVWGEHKGAGIGIKAVSKDGIALIASSLSNGTAALFQGDVEVTGDIRLSNADCAEEFTIAAGGAIEPGTVVVLGAEDALCPSSRAYDSRVVGVVSGAGAYKPGIVLDKRTGADNRQPIALLGKVFCKVDARGGAVQIGDLLTTSPTPGHAMKAADPLKAFGAVIGKALRPLAEGTGLIPILVALQ
jgi:hypothetical protein